MSKYVKFIISKLFVWASFCKTSLAYWRVLLLL